ncbi:MAG: hypothetical protein JWN32_180 [Solirubrobacterales bacterium]|jgi:hypothetical protein|nr:hypothetical protein [Solirubrobacterales bacterium]
MHAAIYEVELVDKERATTNLTENVVPGTALAPGLVAGYWIEVGENRGLSVIVFDSEDATRAFMEEGDPPPTDLIRFHRREIGEVVAHTTARETAKQ